MPLHVRENSCSGQFPHTFAQLCICWPHLRIRVSKRENALELGAVGEDAAEQHTRFNVGFDFATILSSPVPCILFDIDPGQLAELNMLIWWWRRLFHSWRVKLPFVGMSASWFLVSTFLIWLDFCPWWWSWSLLRYFQKCKASHRNEKISRLKKHNRRYILQVRCTSLESELCSCFVFLMVCHAASFPAHSLWMSLTGWERHATRQHPNHQDQVRVYRPTSILRPRKWFLILLNCAKLKFVSCTSNLWEQTYDFQSCTKFAFRSILSPQDPQQNQNPEQSQPAVFPTF